MGLLYVFKREFAVTYPHDNKVSLIGTDEVTTDLVIVVRHTGEPDSRVTMSNLPLSQSESGCEALTGVIDN